MDKLEESRKVEKPSRRSEEALQKKERENRETRARVGVEGMRQDAIGESQLCSYNRIRGVKNIDREAKKSK